MGVRAKEVRTELRLSQQEAATFLELSLRAWQKIERDEGTPSGETLLRFKKLGINPGWLLTGIGPKRLDQSTDAPHAAIDTRLLRRLSDTVHAVFVECEQSPPPRAVTFEAGELYNQLLGRVRDIRDEAMVNAAIDVLRREFKERLHTAEPGTGKRSG